MSDTDRQIRKLFHHIRKVVDLLEQALLRLSLSRENKQARAEPDKPHKTATTASSQLTKRAYTLKEVRELVGISRSAIYLALTARDLRAVAMGEFGPGKVADPAMADFGSGEPRKRGGRCEQRMIIATEIATELDVTARDANEQRTLRPAKFPDNLRR